LSSPNRAELIEKILNNQIQLEQHLKDSPPDAWLALNLTIAQLKSLLFIKFEGETNFKNLAAALGVTPPNVTGIIDRLVEQDLVSREYNQLNRREQRLKLTAKGMGLIIELKERLMFRHSVLLERLDIEDLAALARGITALNKVAQDYRTTSGNEIDQGEPSQRRAGTNEA
jgi:MarR family transcriptional regulator, organic hydroperoxide resistance regulator